MRLRWLRLLPLSLAVLSAQTPALEYTGKPLRIPFQCAADDMHAFGLTCPSGEPCPVYLELAGIEAVGSRLFAAGNLHADTVTLASILLASQDGGKTWTEPHERIRGAGLDLIQFLDFETGWIGGQLLGTTTRDPFLLLTTDGGKTWRRRPVFNESRTGALDDFQFDTKTHGWLWIDRSQAAEADARYESYESMTGGESWAVRETGSRPLKKSAQPAGASDWRVRADRATKAYRLEHRGPSGWETTAAFLVQVGECREAEPAFDAEPPPEPVQPEESAEPEPAPEPTAPLTLRRARP